MNLAGKKIITTVGLPYSGKTTWAKQQGHPIVNRDAIRLALHGERYLQAAEPMVTVLEENMIKSLFIAGHDVVIIDATHNTEKRRKRWHDFAKGGGAEWEPVFFNVGRTVCIERAMAEGDDVIIPVIHRMYGEADWEVPS